MIDLNTLLTATLQQALEGLLKPYEERIAELEKKLELSENSMRKIAKEVCENELEQCALDLGSSKEAVRLIAQESCQWALADHLEEFDHEPLSDFTIAVREKIEAAVESLYSDSLKNQLEQLLSKASMSINL